MNLVIHNDFDDCSMYMSAQRYSEQCTEVVGNKSDTNTVCPVVHVSASCYRCCRHSCQVQLLSAMQLASNPLPQSGTMSLPSTLSGDRTSDLTGGGSSGNAAYVSNFVPLYPGQMTAGGAALVAPDPLAQCLTGPDVVGSDSAAAAAEAPSVITHTAVSTVTASQATTTFSQGSVSQQQQQTFAMPRPLRPSSASANKNANSSVQRIAPAPAPQLFITGLSIIFVFGTYLRGHLNSTEQSVSGVWFHSETYKKYHTKF